MGSAKWIAGFLGWVSAGPIGGLIGFLIGSVVDSGIEAARNMKNGGKGGFTGTGGSSSSNSSGYGGGSSYQRTYRSGYSATEQRNSFFVSLMVLSSAVIKADGRVQQSEVDYVKGFIRNNFGDDAVSEAMRILQDLNSKEINLYSVGSQIADNMNYSQRLQLFHYLAQLAMADGEFSKQEKDVLEVIASMIRITSTDAASVIAMFWKDADSAYSVLEISPSATDDEVKAAYRRMAMKNHPDKVATLGPEVQRAAAEKFRQVQEAYETIKKQRGMS